MDHVTQNKEQSFDFSLHFGKNWKKTRKYSVQSRESREILGETETRKNGPEMRPVSWSRISAAGTTIYQF